MKLFLAIFFMFFSKGNDLQDMRRYFSSLSKGEEHCLGLITISKTSLEVNNTLKRAYFAAGEMASAQYKFGPLAKLNTFNAGKKILDECAKTEPDNPEIRFIRYAIQLKCPAFLGYIKNKKEDKQVILRHMPLLRENDKELFATVCTFMLLHADLSPSEKLLLSK
jgi:hypothetical protein